MLRNSRPGAPRSSCMMYTDRAGKNSTPAQNGHIMANAAGRAATRRKATENAPTTNEENTVTEPTETATPDAEKAPRVTRTPAERAQSRLDSAQKKLAKATVRRDKIAGSIGDAEKDVARAARLVEFCKDDEDLPVQVEQDTLPGVEGDGEDLSNS